MPRVREVYLGQGEWREVTASGAECPHPRAMLRFYADALPTRVYCMACGEPNLHPFHGLSDERIAKIQAEAQALWEALS